MCIEKPKYPRASQANFVPNTAPVLEFHSARIRHPHFPDPDIIAAIRNGEIVVLVDAEDRETRAI